MENAFWIGHDIDYCTNKEVELSKEIEMIRGNIEINRRNKEIIEMIRRNKNNNGIWEKKEKDFMGYITCCAKKIEELSDKIECIRSRIEMIRLHKEYIRSEIEKIRRNEGYIRSKIEKICLNKDQSIDVAFKKMNPSLYLHMYEDITAGMVCIRTVLYTAHGMGPSEIANLGTCLSGMAYPEERLLMLLSETRLSRMLYPKLRDLGMLYPKTRLSGITDPETRLSGMTDPETRLSGMTDPERMTFLKLHDLGMLYPRFRDLWMLYPETRLLVITDPETRLSRMLYPETHLSEMAYPKTRLSGMTDPEACLSGMAYPTRSLNKQQKYLNEYLQNNEEKTAKNKYLIYLLMFGNIVWSGLLATSERGKISSVLGYLLGNDGAHSYNGNGLPLTTMRPATLPMNVLFRKPTNEELAIIATKMGPEYIPLACFLGFCEAELDQLENDFPKAVPRTTRLLLRWRDTKDTNPTVKKLADAFCKLGFDPYIVYDSLETVDKLPKEFLQRELTDKEIARILMKITIMYVSLAFLLGFTKAQLDEMRKVFNQVLKLFEMFKREDAVTSTATIEKVIYVLGELGIIPDIIPDIISSSLGLGLISRPSLTPIKTHLF